MKFLKSKTLLSAACAALLSACTTAGTDIQANTDLPATFITEPGFDLTEQPEGEWWLGFDDPVLTGLMRSAQADNLDIASALSQLDIAIAQTAASRSDLFPTLDGFLNSEISGLLTSGLDADFSSSVGAGLAFDPDIMGQNSNRLNAVMSELNAAAFSLADVRRLVTQAVALEYVEYRRASARLSLLESTLDLQHRTLEIVEARYRAGLSPKLDVDRTEADLAQTQAQRSQYLADRLQSEYALQNLLGQPAQLDGIFSESSDDIPTLVNAAPIGIPADLVRNRPDVRAAEASLMSEISLVSVEQADLYPSLTLPGQIQVGLGDVSSTADDIGYSLGAQLDIPIFDFGRRQGEVDAQIARAQLAAITYRSTLLDALQEVESALVTIEAHRQTLVEQRRAVSSSQAAYDQLDALYREGLASFIDVLDAQRTLISSRESIVQTEASLAIATISLYSALDVGCGDVALAGCDITS